MWVVVAIEQSDRTWIVFRKSSENFKCQRFGPKWTENKRVRQILLTLLIKNSEIFVDGICVSLISVNSPCVLYWMLAFFSHSLMMLAHGVIFSIFYTLTKTWLMPYCGIWFHCMQTFDHLFWRGVNVLKALNISINEKRHENCFAQCTGRWTASKLAIHCNQ